MQKFDIPAPCYPGTIEADDATGITRITLEDGRVVELDKEGNSNINMPELKKVSIDNILNVVSYEITTDADEINHRVKFADGGFFELKLAITGPNTAKPSFNGRQCSYTVTKNCELKVGMINTLDKE